ncbi:hypothetical protein KJN74_04435 [Candidatus Bathyarchaeota archaeon]|nr:hypothetical protein [Candidatus Bathyarchaeota archaeon]
MQKGKSFFERFRKEPGKSNQKTVKKESNVSGCPYSFGYLTHLPKSVPIPQQCMFCRKLLNCRYKNTH